MKKFLLCNAAIVLAGAMLLGIARIITPDCGVYRSKNIANADVLPIAAFDDGIGYFSEVEKWLEFIKERNADDDWSLLYVTANDTSEYYFRSTIFSMHVDQVLIGDEELLGQDIQAKGMSDGFYEYNEEDRQMTSANLKSNGHNEEQCPDLFTIKDVYYSTYAPMKPGHRYIIAVKKELFGESFNPYYYIASAYYDSADASNDKLVSAENPSIKHYPDNITYFYRQEDLDTYCKFQKELFAYFGILD